MLSLLVIIETTQDVDPPELPVTFPVTELPVTFRNLLDDNQLACSTSRQTVSQSNLFPRFCRIELTKQSLKYRGPLNWNSIPVAIR